jgi:hypothetical protein
MQDIEEVMERWHADQKKAAATSPEAHAEQERQRHEHYRRGRERRATYERQSRELQEGIDALQERIEDTYVPPSRVLTNGVARPRAARALTRRRGAGRPKAQATRSSARSGDSGDDPSEPPRPATALAGVVA